MPEPHTSGDRLQFVVKVPNGDAVFKPRGRDGLLVNVVDAHRRVGVVLGVTPEVLLKLGDRALLGFVGPVRQRTRLYVVKGMPDPVPRHGTTVDVHLTYEAAAEPPHEHLRRDAFEDLVDPVLCPSVRELVYPGLGSQVLLELPGELERLGKWGSHAASPSRGTTVPVPPPDEASVTSVMP
jgi:hypothetical protein